MTHHDWLKIMVRGARCLDALPFGLTIVDPRTGEIAHHNEAMATLLGQPVPATVADLDALGLVPALVREEFVALGRSLDDEDRHAVVDTTVEHPDGSVRELRVHLAHFHALRGEGSVLAITVMGFDNTFDYQDLEWSLNPPGEIHVVYDLDLVAVAADQGHVEYGIDPAAQIGTQGFLVSHPEDAVAVSPKVRAVVTVRRSTPSTRCASSGPRRRGRPCRSRSHGSSEPGTSCSSRTPPGRGASAPRRRGPR